MQRLSNQSVDLLFDCRRNPFPVPARVWQAVGRTTASVAMILLLSSITGLGASARAEFVVTTQSRNASATDPFAQFVVEAAQRFGVPGPWIGAVMAMESGGDVRALSPQGAMGLMQIMPDTWADLRARYGLGADPYEPRDNILAGTAYLREMHDRYGSPGFLAAYNAGPTRYEEYLSTGRELPAETQLYVAALAPIIGGAASSGTVAIARRVVPWQGSPLFVALDGSNPSAKPLSSLGPSNRFPVDGPVDGLPALAPRADGLFAQRVSVGRSP
jgi:hypothetical protein